MLMAEDAVEIPVLRRQGKSIREIGADARRVTQDSTVLSATRWTAPLHAQAQPLQALLR
jgi:hypothetical protein